MTIDFSYTLSQQINFGNLSFLAGLTSKTIMFRYYLDAYPAATATILRLRNVDGTDEGFQIDIGTTGKLGFVGLTFSTAGLWSATSAVLALNTWNNVAITYNKSSSANDPIIYVKGSSVAITESVSPSGGAVTGTGGIFFMGGSGTTRAADAKIEGLCIYNRVMTSAEIQSAISTRLMIPAWSGLVFAPNLNGPAGGLADGATMAAGNTIRDIVSGATGTPSGSPVFRNNNILSLGGE